MAKIKGITGLVTEPIASSHHKIPSVSTANLPGAGVNAAIPAADGMIVYNTTLGMLQQRSAGIWSGITTAPVITSFTYSDGASATAEKTVVGLVSISCTTQTSTTVLVPGASLGIEVGQVVAGTGIPVGATVVSVIEDTSFVISAAATASATVTLTFGGAVTITGSNFDSILAGGAANIAVTFDGTSATSISVNSSKSIITCTPPAHAAGTITLLITNASGLTASADFIYDIEPIFTTAAGTLGNFIDGAFTANSDAPRIQGTEDGVALTTGFQRVTSASDDTVITTTIQGLTVLTSGYLTGTLSATEGTTYPFYATAMDNENQRTAPRLFNIVSRHAYPTGGTRTPTTISGVDYQIHVFPVGTNNFVVSNVASTCDILIVAGGAAGGETPGDQDCGRGGGGAGGLLYRASYSVSVGSHSVTVGDGGAGRLSGDGSATPGNAGGNSVAFSVTANGGGGGGCSDAFGGPVAGGCGGGGAGRSSVNLNGAATNQSGFSNWTHRGNAGGNSAQGNHSGGGGGGAGAVGSNKSGSLGATSQGGAGGVGYDYSSIFGTAVGESGWFAGGGGGGTYKGQTNASAYQAPGGNGGGGNGVFSNESQGSNTYAYAIAGASATAATGGGGGGCAEDAFQTNNRGSYNGWGGSGVVVIRYLT